MQNESKLVYSVIEVAKLLAISRGTCYQRCREHKIPCLILGKRILIPKIGLERMLAEAGKGSQNENH